MCRKIKKEAWYTEPNIIDELEKTLDYKFLELLVLFDSRSDISDRLKKVGKTTESYSDTFVDQLRPLLRTPDRHLAKELKLKFHPILREEKRPKTAGLHKIIPFRKTKSLPPRSKSAPPLRPVKSENWTMVTPVPHLKCPCHPKRTYTTQIVTKEDVMTTEMHKRDIQFRLQTGEEKQKRELKHKLEDYFNKYKIQLVSREQHPPRPSSVPVMPTTTNITREVPQGSSAFERLSTPRRRLPPQSPCHAAACDAYKQGIATKEGLGKPRVTISKRGKKIKKQETNKNMEDKEPSYIFVRLY